MRYAFRRSPPPAALKGRQTSAAMLFVAVVIIFLTQDTAAIILSLILAMIAGVFILKPPDWQWYVEVTDEKLIIKVALFKVQVKLSDIASVELDYPRYPPILRFVANVFLLKGKIFGSGHDLLKPEGNPANVIVRFRKWLWRPLPRRSWRFEMEDPESFFNGLTERLRGLG